jgi:hypothetical protein
MKKENYKLSELVFDIYYYSLNEFDEEMSLLISWSQLKYKISFSGFYGTWFSVTVVTRTTPCALRPVPSNIQLINMSLIYFPRTPISKRIYGENFVCFCHFIHVLCRSQTRLLPSFCCPDNILWDFKIMKTLCHFIHFPAFTKPYFQPQIRQKIEYEDQMRWNAHIYTIPDSFLVLISHMLSTTFTCLYNFISAVSFKVISGSFLVTSRIAVIVYTDNL